MTLVGALLEFVACAACIAAFLSLPVFPSFEVTRAVGGRSPRSWIGPVDPLLFLECLVARVDHLVPYSLNAFVIFVACVRYPTLGMLTEPFVSGIRHWECALGSFCLFLALHVRNWCCKSSGILDALGPLLSELGNQWPLVLDACSLLLFPRVLFLLGRIYIARRALLLHVRQNIYIYIYISVAILAQATWLKASILGSPPPLCPHSLADHGSRMGSTLYIIHRVAVLHNVACCHRYA